MRFKGIVAGPRLFGLLLAVSVLIGCDKSMPTEPSRTTSPTPPPTPAPSPTPVPVPEISGGWRGTLDGLCLFDPYKPSVTAELAQHGAVVTGRFSGGGGRCSLTGDFSGSLLGATLSGSIGTTTLSGSASGSELVLHVSSSSTVLGAFPTLSGTLTLRR